MFWTHHCTQSLSISVFKQTYRTVFFSSPMACTVDFCQTVIHTSVLTLSYIYMPAYVWHILTMKRTSLCFSFWVFQNESHPDSKGNVIHPSFKLYALWLLSSGYLRAWRTTNRGCGQGPADLWAELGSSSTLLTCVRSEHKKGLMLNTWLQPGVWMTACSMWKKSNSKVALAVFFLSPLNFHKLLSASAHVGCFLCRFEMFWHCKASVAHLKQQQNLQKTTWQRTISYKT